MAERPPDAVTEGWRDGNDRTNPADGASNGLNERAVSEGFWPNGVDDGAVDPSALRYGKGGKVVYEDGLEPVLTAAEHTEDGKTAQKPRDVVDEDVLLAE